MKFEISMESFRLLSIGLLMAGASAGCMPAAAQQAVWKCGDLFTDRPPDNSRRPCIELEGAAAHAFRSLAKAVPEERKEAARAPVAAVAAVAAAQSSRDRESRQILETELAAAVARRDLLRNKQATQAASRKTTASRNDPALVAQAEEINRLDTDIESLRREIARLPADKNLPEKVHAAQ